MGIDRRADCLMLPRNGLRLWGSEGLCRLLKLLQRRTVFEALTRLLKPSRLWDLFAFGSGLPAASTTGDVRSRLQAEYARIISSVGYHNPGKRSGSFGKGAKDLRSESTQWRVSDVNAGYSMSPTYPSHLIVPTSVRYLLECWFIISVIWLEIFAEMLWLGPSLHKSANKICELG